MRTYRRVKVFRIHYDFENQTREEDGEAWFHQWGVDFCEFINSSNETERPARTVAIIERDDGKVEMIKPDLIEFIEDSKLAP